MPAVARHQTSPPPPVCSGDRTEHRQRLLLPLSPEPWPEALPPKRCYPLYLAFDSGTGEGPTESKQ
jgi:hypothetical protein